MNRISAVSFISKKLILVASSIFLGTVLAYGTRGNLLKFIPVIDYFITASPPFFQVVKNGFSGVVSTGFGPVLGEFLLAAIAFALLSLH